MALIITIIVLLILAVVAIRAVQGDGILQYAKNSKSETIKAQQKEEIMLALNEWKLAKHTVPGATFVEVMNEKIEGATVTANGEESVKVQFDGAEIAYNVTEAGVITEIKIEEEPVSEDSFVRNSVGKGNYADPETDEGTLVLTGSNPAYQVKHIYDLAGDVWEWTMEALRTNLRVGRGGNYDGGDDLERPASYRYYYGYPDGCDDRIGFRVALYL